MTVVTLGDTVQLPLNFERGNAQALGAAVTRQEPQKRNVGGRLCVAPVLFSAVLPSILTLGALSAHHVAGQAPPRPQLVREDPDGAASDDHAQESLLALKLAQTVAVADFTGDGIADVAVADFVRDVVIVMASDSEGRLTTIASLPAGRGPRSLVARDFDLDGNLDIAVASLFSGDVRIFAGGGSGQFAASRTLYLAPGVSSLSGNDIDGDGDADLTVANFLSGEVSVFAASGGGVFEGARAIGRARGTSLILHRDLNGDGVPDVLAVDASGTGGRLFAGHDGGTFEDAGLVPLQVTLPDDLQSDVSRAGEMLTLRIVSGNGQAARSGALLPEAVVFEAIGLDGTGAAGSRIVFSTIAGPHATVETPQWTNEDGTAALQLVAAEAPQNQLIAAAMPGVGVVVAGAVSALSPDGFQRAIPQSAIEGPNHARAALLRSAVDGLMAGDEVEAVAALMSVIEAASATSAPETIDALSDLARRVINQILTIGPAAPGPDLVETAVSDPPAVVTLKDKFNVTDTARNQGTTLAAASTTRYYLSLDGVQKTKLLGGGGRNVPALNPGVDSAGSDMVTVPVSAKPGTYFVLACADDRGAVVEDNENNNCSASTAQVEVKAADLIVSALSEPPANVAEGSDFSVSDTTSNTGNFTAGSSRTNYFLSLDKKQSKNDFLIAGRVVPSLAPGQNSAGSATATASAPLGTYYLLACADGLKKVPEGNANKSGEKNNCTASTGQVTVVPGGADGGPVDNGTLATGRIGTAGEVDEWTFTASAGQRIAVHIGEIVDDNDFRPWIRLLAPNDAELASFSGVSAAVIDDVVAPATGTYRVRVASFDSGLDGTGTYRLTTVRTPGPITVSAADQGGPLTNGAIHEGQILQGDVDVWTFTATAGERISVHLGEITDTDDFRPWLRLWAPNGASLQDIAGVSATVVDDAIAPVTGTYLVQVASFDSGVDGEGTYRMTLTKTSGPISVSPGDQGGPLTNGAIHEGQILQGDVDIWTFTATAGERISLHLGQITETDDFWPWLRLWAPNGASLEDVAGVSATVIDDAIAPVTGTYLVQVASFDSGVDGEGTYRMTLTKTSGPISVSPGDQGGPLTNGAIHEGQILQGDVDIWTFSATAGDRISLHLGEITDTDDFRPWLRLWAPNGASLEDIAGVSATVIDDAIAPVTGTYLVQVASFDSGVDGEGTYRMTLTKTPGPIAVSPGDQGGPMTNGANHDGQILQGDVDVWTFTANAGERISLHLGELTDTDDFRPWLRLWAPNGASLEDTAGVSVAVVDDAIAPATGTYLVQVASFDSGVDGEGTYRLTLAKTPGPITVSPGDEGGPLTDGATHVGAIAQGDVDVWTITVTAGQNISVTINETAETSDYRPWIRLWAPNGATLGDTSGLTTTQINGVATVTGTYLVLVGSFDSGFDGAGSYSLVVDISPP